jgi:hypothetical protein
MSKSCYKNEGAYTYPYEKERKINNNGVVMS